jgi:predicted nucleotidyltransferase component of viral defense system
MNSAASIRARLLNVSKQSGEDFQAILTRYAIERFLYRLGASEQRDAFILKGAMLFVAWQGNLHRPTKDLDLLGFGSASVQDVARRIREIARMPGDDGIVFEPDSIVTEIIKEDAEYEGVRAKLVATLERARIRMQIDVGFGDAVQLEARTSEFPTVLKLIEPPILRMYPPEVVIAEKLHAMVVLDIRNSRMKDFFDIWYLARTQSFDLPLLRGAIEATFERRGTSVPIEIPFALTEGFLLDETKRQQWRGFLQRLQLEADTPDLMAVGTRIVEFVGPLLTDGTLSRTWHGDKGWHD